MKAIIRIGELLPREMELGVPFRSVYEEFSDTILEYMGVS